MWYTKGTINGSRIKYSENVKGIVQFCFLQNHIEPFEIRSIQKHTVCNKKKSNQIYCNIKVNETVKAHLCFVDVEQIKYFEPYSGKELTVK